MSASFACVFVPADAAEPMAEWRVCYDAKDADSAVGCLMDRLQQHYREQDACFRATASPSEQAARRDQVAQTLRGVVGGAAASSSSSSSNPALVDTLAGLTHLVGQVALVDACKASSFDAVTMYVRDLGKAMGLPVNARATAVCHEAGLLAETIHGDAVVARYHDDGGDDFRRCDFHEAELSADAPWMKLARARNAARAQNSTPEALARAFSATTTSSSSSGKNTTAGTKHVCADGEIGCTNEATLRCSRCKKVWYCSKECQKKHWPVHKARCVPAPK